MPAKSALSERQLLVDRLIRIDQGYFERDQVCIVPTYHLICTQTGEKLAKIELVSTDKAAVFELVIAISCSGVRKNRGVSSASLGFFPKNTQRSTFQWTYEKFIYFLRGLVKAGSFEETVISLFP